MNPTLHWDFFFVSSSFFTINSCIKYSNFYSCFVVENWMQLNAICTMKQHLFYVYYCLCPCLLACYRRAINQTADRIFNERKTLTTYKLIVLWVTIIIFLHIFYWLSCIYFHSFKNFDAFVILFYVDAYQSLKCWSVGEKGHQRRDREGVLQSATNKLYYCLYGDLCLFCAIRFS
jgi:hypothetical protein